MKWYKSESTEMPDEVDSTSSKIVVYLRRNIVEKQSESDTDGETQTYYEYEEAKLTKDEYDKYLKKISITDINQLRADIDYLAIMADISLDEV